MQYLTAGHAGSSCCANHASNLDAAFDAGLSGSGRLHDLLVNFHAVTPGELKRDGAGLTIQYGFHPSPFGECLIAVTARGVCHLGFVPPEARRSALAELAAESAVGRAQRKRRARRPRLRAAVHARHQPFTGNRSARSGTNFQIKVWEALSRIPPGSVASYEDIARRIRAPRAVRAVADAVAANRWPG